MINIVLFEPEIPQNTGNIIRLAANTGSRLHLVQPFGFTLEDKKMRRAGLDYHEFAGIQQYEDWNAFIGQHGDKRLFGISTKGTRHYSEVAFLPDDFLVFGPESRGLPATMRDTFGTSHLLRIPMLEHSRSLNLANAAAVIVYEAWRQQGFIHGN